MNETATNEMDHLYLNEVLRISRGSEQACLWESQAPGMSSRVVTVLERT